MSIFVELLFRKTIQAVEGMDFQGIRVLQIRQQYFTSISTTIGFKPSKRMILVEVDAVVALAYFIAALEGQRLKICFAIVRRGLNGWMFEDQNVMVTAFPATGPNWDLGISVLIQAAAAVGALKANSMKVDTKSVLYEAIRQGEASLRSSSG